ncbi:hypothetical protein MLD38_019506 [Melastoma candidum]|uniref:Uncharacterized protein n=1 Tax=Melastoma candidum TaxID=119954 RepID=A0ACB9QX72_9MYRT|nr:hypothetical protein MLD38_019506 [Melastoma candidum]
MPRKRTKRTAVSRSAAASSVPREDEDNKPAQDLFDLEVERRVAAIRAIRDVEIDTLLTELRLLRSCLKVEQLDAIAFQFLGGILPNADPCEDGLFNVNLGGKDEMTSRDDAEERILASMCFRHRLAAFSGFKGHEFQSGAGRAGALGIENLQMHDFVLDEQMENHMLGLPESLRTPGFASQRLSIGMTPKTLRLPKPGEMLLSVHGSPLGVYKEENLEMESINETDEG